MLNTSESKLNLFFTTRQLGRNHGPCTHKATVLEVCDGGRSAL